MTEKSDSTVDVLGNTEARPPQKSFRVLNRPRSGFHPSSNDILPDALLEVFGIFGEYEFTNTDCADHLKSH